MPTLKNRLYRLLRWSERYTKIDNLYLAKSGSWLVFGQAVSALSSFIFAVVLANLFSKELYGTYQFVLAGVAILSIFTLPGMATALMRSVAHGHDGTLPLLLRLRMHFGLLAALASLTLTLYYFLNGNAVLSLSFLIAAIFLPFMDPLNLYISFLQGKQKFSVSSRYMMAEVIISTITLIIVLLFTQNFFLLLFSYFSSHTFLRYFFLVRTQRKFLTNAAPDQSAISYGKHLSLQSILTTLSSHLDRFLMFTLIGSASLATYAVALAVPVQMKSLCNIYLLAFPRLSKKTEAEARQGMGDKILRYTLFMSGIFIAYILIAPLFYRLFFPTYPEAVLLSQIYALVLLLVPKVLYRAFFEAQQKTKELYVFNSIISVLRIVLVLVSIIFFGIIGGVIALVGTELIGYLMLATLYHRRI